MKMTQGGAPRVKGRRRKAKSQKGEPGQPLGAKPEELSRRALNAMAERLAMRGLISLHQLDNDHAAALVRGRGAHLADPANHWLAPKQATHAAKVNRDAPRERNRTRR